ncbi:hypothetical protein KW790_01005 [Candidatus Parcubacteria bacterium]|nr:hypothetical protein [Candidatus Parcubacteria bacterium]
MSEFAPKLRVAVLRGGPSPEYDVSLKTGGHVLSILRDMPDKYEPVDIFISHDGQWHLRGAEALPYRALHGIDVVFNALHGAYGEDGQVQRLLSSLNIPYTGSRAVASALAMNKDMAKEVYKSHGLLTPSHELIRGDVNDDHLIYIFRNYLHPVIIKPATAGSSIGMKVAHTFHELKEGIKHALTHSNKVLVEEKVMGKDASCGILENFRGEKLYAFMPHPTSFSTHIHKSIEDMSRIAHKALGLRHYSESDFVVTPRGHIYILETNSSPKFHEESPLVHSLAHVGVPMQNYIHHIISLAH